MWWGAGWFQLHNIATLQLELASRNLPDFQYNWDTKIVLECGNDLSKKGLSEPFDFLIQICLAIQPIFLCASVPRKWLSGEMPTAHANCGQRGGVESSIYWHALIGEGVPNRFMGLTSSFPLAEWLGWRIIRIKAKLSLLFNWKWAWQNFQDFLSD